MDLKLYLYLCMTSIFTNAASEEDDIVVSGKKIDPR